MAFQRKRGYDRARLLARAASALRHGRRRRALALYESVLAQEPENGDLRRRVAPLLARSGRVEEALRSYRIAAEALSQRGFFEHAIGVYREAAQRLPRQREVWDALADLELRRQKPMDANRVLLKGARQLRGRARRSDAVLLLLRARKLDPRHVETGLALARALARVGARRRAVSLLAEISSWTRGRALRRVRARQLLVAPGPVNAWRWLAAWVGR